MHEQVLSISFPHIFHILSVTSSCYLCFSLSVITDGERESLLGEMHTQNRYSSNSIHFTAESWKSVFTQRLNLKNKKFA